MCNAMSQNQALALLEGARMQLVTCLQIMQYFAPAGTEWTTHMQSLKSLNRLLLIPKIIFEMREYKYASC